MKRKWKKRIFTFLTAMMAVLLMSVGLFELAGDLSAIRTYATGGNHVYLASQTVEASDSGLVYVDLVAYGDPNENISVIYRTASGTAIENVDYAGVYNAVNLKIDNFGNASYRISIKTLNDATTREKLRVDQGNETFGRYFTLYIDSVSNNATIDEGKGTCKCYLPYDHRVNAKTYLDGTLQREISYLEDYEDNISKYHKGEGDISGKDTWKTWKEGVSFNNDTTKRWINTYINPGFATAYGSYVLSSIDDDHLHSESNIYLLSGNKEFMDKYTRSSSCPGLSLFYEIEPCTKGGYMIDGRAMYYIAMTNKNPWKQVSELVDLEERNYIPPADRMKRVYWIQKEKTWFSNKNSIYDSVFFRTDPYNGVLDYGLAIFNNNKSWDREVHNLWFFLRLIDDTCPTIVSQYTEYNPLSKAVRVYLRFNEPVYTFRKSDLTVKINRYNTNFYAKYVDGNFSDTLVYEIQSAPSEKIDRLAYELPNDEIADLAYNLDAYKIVRNNFVQNTSAIRETVISGGKIDLAKPYAAVDIQASGTPKSSYEIMVSANGNGENSFDTGTVYYSFDQNDYIAAPSDPSSYKNAHVLTSEERGSFPVTLAKSDSLGIDVSGSYYLHVLVVSKYGETSVNTFGPYLLDGDAPEIELLAPEDGEDTLRSKVQNLRVKDKTLGTDIETIDMTAKYEDEDGNATSATLRLLDGGAVPSSISNIVTWKPEDSGGASILKYKSNIDEEDLSTPRDEFITGLLGSRSRLTVELQFEVTDEAGNKAKSSTRRTVYDKRALFATDIAAPASYQKDDSIDDVSNDVFDIASAGSGDGITFTVNDADTKQLIDDGAQFSVVVNGKQTFDAVGYSVKLTDLGPGYYEAVGQISGDANGTAVDLVSKAYCFYLTNARDDATVNKTAATGNLVLTNRVFEIEDARFYYFKSSDNSIGNILYGATYDNRTSSYQGGSSAPAFSNATEAKKYVKFMEYRDLELIEISSLIASFLNSSSGSTVYVKAPNETKNAQEGQLWIRYKKATWTPGSNASSWGFYYYGDGKLSDGININALSTNLSGALDSVTNRIIADGNDRYLVGEDNVERLTGAPYLSPSQMHVEKETATETMSGNPFLSNPVYAGDAGLYRNEVSVYGESYPLASNLALHITSATSLYFQTYGGSEWTKLEAEDGTILKRALSAQATGLYKIREYGEEGVGEFTVYLDHSIPIVRLVVDEGLASETVLTLDGSTNVPISGKTVAIKGFLSQEADPQAYIAVYSYPNHNLVDVLYADRFDTYDYSLTGGNYYLEVGDRSGNVITYTVWTSDTDMGLSVAENDSKTAVIVRVNNRSESEIYSYEVYLNEVLIDNEFSTYKIYRGAGIYRIEVVDIYGNRETVPFTHESPTPELTWYYLNDNGGYSTYDPNNPVKMILEDDPSSPRTTNVLSSTMIRVRMSAAYENSEVEFELLDIDPSDYSYNPTTGLLSINTLSSWRLRVWYSGEPENDRTYVFQIDSDSPEVSASCVGTTYNPYVLYDTSDPDNPIVIETSSFDSVDFNRYAEGDAVTLDNLRWVNNGESSITFHDGSVICGNRVVLQLYDPSGIRQATVTRNGAPVNVELDSENRLILNGYGSYVVTATDNLGNVTTFRFVNVEGDIAVATVDGNEIEQAIEIGTPFYGHDSLEVATLFDGTNIILVKVGEESFTYEFRYASGVLTYGQYFVTAETYLDDDDHEVTVKSGEYVEATGFRLALDDDFTRRNNWYIAVSGEKYAIYAMIDDSGLAHYRIASLEGEVSVETRFRVGSGHTPARYYAILSNEIPSLVLLGGGKSVTVIESLDYIYVADTITIDKASISSNISTIEIAYSETELFGDMTLAYNGAEWLFDFEGTAEGYYMIRVRNIYGNETAYKLCKIKSFASVVNIHTLDGATITFTGNDDTFYANHWIELIVFSTEVTFEIDGVPNDGVLGDGFTTLTILEDGDYNVSAIGANGVREDFTFSIHSDDSFYFRETWIIGYNEDALLRHDGYTNSFCSITEDAPDNDVVFIDMTVNDDTYVVLYDSITGKDILDLERLKDAVGRYGVGKYVVGFRNKYGDLTTKTIYYNNLPSIVLTRSTSSDPNSVQVYDLGLAVSKGFYSNYSLTFSTTSSTYRFTVQGNPVSLETPYTLEFTNASGNGSFDYLVTYLDEYGNYVKFTATLLRDDVEFDVSSMHIIEVGSAYYTRDDVKITFEEGLKATMSVDGGEAVDYASGETHYADGEYRFVVRDIAGNIATFTIIHKSVNHFSFLISSSGEDVIDGGVVNDSNVVFYSDEGSRIKYVVRNGELVEDYNSTTFSMTGHYEVLIEDQIGNQAYKEFTILNNDLATFTYNAPYDYEVSEVWRMKPDGTRELLSLSGASITLDENGDYLVVVKSTKTASIFNFSVGIDDSAPTAKLVGVNDGEVTARDVSVSGLRTGDVVKIYKDGVLISTTTVTLSSDVPTITSGGRYKVTVTNLQGVTLEFNFVRKAVANVPGSIFVIVFSVLVVVAVGIGLTYHTKLKTDE